MSGDARMQQGMPYEPSGLTGPVEGGVTPAEGASMPVIGTPRPRVEDVPAGALPTAVPAVRGQASPAAYPVPRPAHVQDRMTSTDIMGTTKRSGRWVVPAEIVLTSVMSDTHLDLREAIVSSPEVRITIYGGMTSTKIIVPPGVGVRSEGGAKLLSDVNTATDEIAAPGCYQVVVTEYSLMSTLKVLTLAPGEDEPKWWKPKR